MVHNHDADKLKTPSDITPEGPSEAQQINVKMEFGLSSQEETKTTDIT
jgi:hypothetical protein